MNNDQDKKEIFISLKDRLRKEFLLGLFSKTTDSSIVEAAGYGGFDFIILDMEHGPVDLIVMQNHIRACLITGMAPIARVPDLDSNIIGSVLDIGVAGIQVPNITNAKQAMQVVEAARFYPSGNRGVCCYVRAAQYGKMPKEKYFSLNEQPLIVIQVEGVAGINNIDDILNVQGIDVLFIGPYDLSQSLGTPGRIDTPEASKMIEKIITKAKSKEIILGIYTDTPEEASFYYKKGFRYLSCSVDLCIFRKACEEIKNNMSLG